MKVIGYCTVGFHIRYVEATGAAIVKAQATKGVIEGVCDSCRREQEKEKRNG